VSTTLHGKVIFADTEGTGLVMHGPWRSVDYAFGQGKNVWHETRSVCPARPFAYSFADLDGNAQYYSVGVNNQTREPKPMSDKMVKGIATVLDDPSITKVLHNPRYDLLMYHYAGFRVRGPVIDTQILSHVATRGSEFSYMLKPLAKKYAEYPDDDEKTLMKEVHKQRRLAKLNGWSYAVNTIAGKDPAKADMWMVQDEVTKDYAVGDVLRCCLLYHLWYDEVMGDPNMKQLFEREHKLMWTLKKMEDRGVRVFPDTVRELRVFYQDYKKEQSVIAEANGGKGLNYNSPAQMAKKFYEERGHTPNYTQSWNKKLNRFNYSLNGEQLLRLATGYAESKTEEIRVRNRVTGKVRTKKRQVIHTVAADPLAKAVLEYKAANQTIASFLDVYERLWVEESPDVWVLHPNFKQTGTITGRLSCSDPNLQQVASETTGRRKADIQSRPREAFGPRPGYVWYLPDYSQIEVWLFAFMSGEQKMQEALLSGQDFHGGIAKQVFGSRPDFDAHKDYYRKCAKLIMFAKLYGGGLGKLALLLKMPMDQAKRFIEDYEANLPGVRLFMQRMITRAQREGMIFNPFGRGYSFEPHYAYKSVNYLIQGTAADVMKNALVNVDEILSAKWHDAARLLMTIHDELAVEVPLALHCREMMRDIVTSMQRDQKTLNLPVPLPVELKIVEHGKRWNVTRKFGATVCRDIGAFYKA
jgi:DNA polymerase I-like protein with 3'-5' exonuclease and polymerase domains